MIIQTIKLFKRYIQLLRREIYTKKIKIQSKSFKDNLTVNYNSRVTKNTVLGENVNFNGMKIKGNGEVFIGDNFHSGEECLMITDIHNYDSGKAIPYDNTYISKAIKIESNVWLGDRVIILGGVTIGEGVIVQAGSVIVKSIPKYAIVGGHPAKIFKSRDINHYEMLKEERKFH